MRNNTFEINPNVEWGKLVSDIAKINQNHNQKLTLYQAPNSKWYLKEVKGQNTVNTKQVNHRVTAEYNAEQMQSPISNIQQEIVQNWNTYFDDYSFLSDQDKQIYASLVDNGFVQIQCNF